MTLRTMTLDTMTVRLRRGFQRQTDRDGNGLNDRKQTDAAVYIAEAVVPGLLSFASPSRDTGKFEDRPDNVRIRVLGERPPFDDGALVTLTGGTITAWYQARARGVDASSDITISPASISAARPGDRPIVRGGVPCALPDEVGATLLHIDGNSLDVMFDAAGPFAVEGVAQIHCVHLPDDANALLDSGARIRLVELRAFYTAPDRSDVGRSVKAELALQCSTFTGEQTANGSSRSKRSEPAAPAPEPQPVG